MTAEMTPAKQTAFDWVVENHADWSAWNQLIWHYGETAWREYKSAAWYVAKLREEGFEVEEGSGGMPTAFHARWSNGPGPIVAGYAEYDAVPGNCQQAAPRKGPREGLSIHAGGHTDPHSALGIGALTGVLAAKAAMERHGIGGTLVIFGEPAEKVRGSKPIHAAKGYYDGLDGLISFHPCFSLPLTNTVVWDTHCGAGYAMIYEFACEEPENWGHHNPKVVIPAAHSSSRAPGANDALTQMILLSKAMKDSMLPFASGWTLNETILAAGQATADNIPAQVALLQYMLRVPTVEMAEQVIEVLDRNAKQIAGMTQCVLRKHWVCKSRPGLPNHAISAATYANLELAGAPTFDGEAIPLAQEVQRQLGLEPDAEPYLPEVETLIAPQEAEAALREDLPPWQKHKSSDDYTDMCWHVPTARLYVGRPMLKGPPGFRYPSWAMNALGGMAPCIDPMIASAGKTIAGTLLDLLTKPDLVAAAKSEFEQRTGGGIGGTQWMAPLCDYEPPIHFPWPEYVTTARGEDWWIPAQFG